MRNRVIAHRHHSALAAVLLFALALTVTGCSGSSHVDASNATVVDVRTAAEFASGHLQGAVNIDVTASDFTAKIGALPKDATYLLYCRSGTRAGQALTIMQQQGFAHVTNLGSVQAASSATGLAVVTG